MKLMEASNAFVSMNQRVKETHSILNAGDQFAVEDSRAEFLSGGNSDGIIWAMPIAHLVKVPLKYAEEVDALVAQFLADKSKPVVDEVKEETKVPVEGTLEFKEDEVKQINNKNFKMPF